MHAKSAIPLAASRRLAANLLEAQLLRLARASVIVERRLGPGLLALGVHRLHRRLGFVRLGDYLTERLGMSLRRCQSIVRLERALRDLPAVAAAFDAGALPPSKVRVVASAATPETQDLWLARAQRLTVRDLEAAARASRQAKPRGETDVASRQAGREETGPTSPDAGREETGHTAPGATTDTAPEAGAGTMPLTTQEGVAAGSLAPEEEPGVLISFMAPGRAFALWQWALEFVRRVAGRQEPAWRCAEYLAAEFLSGCPDTEGADQARARSGEGVVQARARSGEVAPDESTLPAARTGGDPSPAAVPVRRPPRCAIFDEEVWACAVAAVRDALRSLGSAADVEAILSAPPPAAPEVPPESTRAGAPPAALEASEPDPWSLDGRLRSFVRLRQSLAWRQGRLLATVAALDLHRDLGYDSLGDWCQCVLGMSPRRARYLVSLDRQLDRLPLVADAYRRGLVSWCQARLLVRVARPGTGSRWVRYARRVTVRRLEDVVTACAVAAADPALGGETRTSSDGAPLPPPEPLPGTAPLSPTEPVRPAEPLPGTAPSSPTEPMRPPEPPQGRHTFAPDDVAASTALSADTSSPARHTLAPHVVADPSGLTRDPAHPARHTLAHGVPAGGSVAAQHARHTLAPEPCTHRISFWAPLDVAAVWRSALRACRSTRGPHLRDWQCLLIFIIEMRDAWQPHENAEWRRRYSILDRDGWRCLAPGCTSRSHLNAHHLVFRSHCGSDDDGNLVTLCVGHHQAGVHDNLIRCHGRAPDAIWWEFGIRPDGPPLLRYFGDRIVGAAASAGDPSARPRARAEAAPAGGTSPRPRMSTEAARTEIGRRGDPRSRPPVRGEPLPRTGSGSCRPLAEFRPEGAAPRAPGL